MRSPPGASFLAFLAAMFLSKLADQVLLFLVPLVVFQATHDAGWSGLAFAAEAFPRFLSFPICGALCDRMSPVSLMHWSQLCRAAMCVAGAMGGAAFGGVGWLIVVSAVCGVLTTQGVMAREVVLPQAFKQLRFEKVLAFSQTADQLGAVLGPVLAATVLADTSWPLVMGGAALVFMLADGATRYWRGTIQADFRPGEPAHGGWVCSMTTGLRHVISQPGLCRLVIQAAGVNLVVGVTLASSAALFTGIHAQTASRYAMLQTTGAITTVLVLMAIAHVAIPVKTLGAAGFSLMVLGGLMTASCASPLGYAAGYLLVTGFDKMFNIYLRSTRQRIIPMADYGKTTGMMTLLNNLTQPVAGVAVGAWAAAWTVQHVILAMTLGMVVLGSASLLVHHRRAQG